MGIKERSLEKKTFDQTKSKIKEKHAQENQDLDHVNGQEKKSRSFLFYKFSPFATGVRMDSRTNG